jgi:hypothetical protein
MDLNTAIALYPDCVTLETTGILPMESPLRAFARELFGLTTTAALNMTLASAVVYSRLAQAYMETRNASTPTEGHPA